MDTFQAQSTVLGFIGFGEAAFHIGKGLIREGLASIRAYDMLAEDPEKGTRIRERASSLGVTLEPSLEALCKHSDILICATSAKSALPIARSVKAFLLPRHLYVDLNAASAFVKQEIDEELRPTGARFADAAVMDSVPGLGHTVPILVSGSGATAFERFASSFGMNVRCMNERAGSASGVKMLRSIFMKGFTSLLFETLAASEAVGATDAILASIEQTLFAKPLEETANGLLTRTVLHAERRVGEMEEVIRTLDHLGVDATLCLAVKKKLQRFVETRSAERYSQDPPERYRDVLSDPALRTNL